MSIKGGITMLARGMKHCLKCGKGFLAKTYRHLFCSRKCFMKNYRSKQKEDKYPSYICEACKARVTLKFHPKANEKKWLSYVCPNCGVPRQANAVTEAVVSG